MPNCVTASGVASGLTGAVVSVMALFSVTACSNGPTPAGVDNRQSPETESGSTEAGSYADCGLRSCGPAFDFKAPLALSFEQVRTASVTVCRNDECFTGKLDLDAPPAPGVNSGLRLPAVVDDSAMSPHVNLWLMEGTQGGFTLAFQWVPWSLGDVRDGDTYKVEFADANGSLFSATEPVEHYTISYANGTACGPRCLTAQVDRTQP